MRPLFGFAAGLVFGLGLILAGMSNPAKVLNFLDLFGSFDPSLAFVMGGAMLTTFVGYRFVWRRKTPLLLSEFQIPTRKDVDAELLTGAALFGVGWGIGGFCPGPAWTALPLLTPGILAFLPAMLVGMGLATLIRARRKLAA